MLLVTTVARAHSGGYNPDDGSLPMQEPSYWDRLSKRRLARRRLLAGAALCSLGDVSPGGM